MKRILQLTRLTLLTACLGLCLTHAEAADIEVRKAVMTEAALTPPPSPEGDDMVVLGTMQVPAELVKKLDAKQLAEILERQAMTPKSTVQHIFNEEILIPAIVFSSITLVSFLMIYYSFRKRREMLDTVRTAIQSGQTLPPSFLEALESRPKPTADSDLRKAVLLIAVGLSGMGVLAALTQSDDEAGRVWAIGLVPTLLGIGYLFLWRQSQKRSKAGSTDDAR